MKRADVKKVAVLYGGLSSEREISLQSGQAVTEALQEQNVEVVAVDVNENFLQQVLDLKNASVNCVFIALHGGMGENGTVQGVLETAGLPYTGTGVAGSALAMNKLHTKQIWLAQNMQTPQYMSLSSEMTWQQVSEKLGGKVIVKPVSEGSSIGMCVANSEASFAKAIDEAFKFDATVIAEQWIEGEEFTVAILGQKPLPVIKLQTPNDFYDFEAKYKSDETQYLCPCGLSEQEEQAMQQTALSAFQALGCAGWGRVDFMRDSAGQSYLLEANTVPGLTSHSLVPMAAKAAGSDFKQLIMDIILQA